MKSSVIPQWNRLRHHMRQTNQNHIDILRNNTDIETLDCVRGFQATYYMPMDRLCVVHVTLCLAGWELQLRHVADGVHQRVRAQREGRHPVHPRLRHRD